MDKKGQAHMPNWVIVVIGIIMGLVGLLVLISFFVSLADTDSKVVNVLNNLLNNGDSIIGSVASYGKTIADIAMDLVAPTDLDEDYRVIALGIFFLLLIVGTKGLNNVFKNWFYSFGLAFFIALIAGRALTSTVIEKYILPSPLSAAAFLVGVLPLLMIYGLMQSWKSGQYIIKALGWVVAAFLYLFIFWFAFQSRAMGVVYFAVVLIAGAVEIFAPYFKMHSQEMKNKGHGKFFALMFSTVNDLKEMQAGAEEASENDLRLKHELSR